MLKKTIILSIILIISICPFVFAGGLTIITHGYNGDMGWVHDAGYKVRDRIISEHLSENNNGQAAVAMYLMTVSGSGTGSISLESSNGIEFNSASNTTGHAIIKIDWRDFAGEPFDSIPDWGEPTDNVAEWIVSWLLNYSGQRIELLSAPIHLIGHSRGGSLVGAMAGVLSKSGCWVDQVTFLDPHPIEGNPGIVGDADWGHAGLFVPGNVIFADNYYRYEGANPCTTGLEPDGCPVTGAYNVLLSESYLETLGYGSIPYEHSDVHAWWRGTVTSDPPPYMLEGGTYFSIGNDWYYSVVYEETDDNLLRPRESVGYAFSLTANSSNNWDYRPISGIHAGINNAGVPRSFSPGSGDLINNVGYLLLGTEVASPTDTFQVSYHYQSWTYDFGVDFFLDDNKNPHDGYVSQLVGKRILGISEGMESDACLVGIPDDQEQGTYYVFARSSGTGLQRSFYAPTQLTINIGPSRPTVSTSAASNIGQTSASLTGNVDPNNLETTAFFQYGETTNYGKSTSSQNVGSGNDSQIVTTNVNDLECETTYHFRIIATNSEGTSYGADKTFTTNICGPLPIITNWAGGVITRTSAEISAGINPNGSSTSAHFEYGVTTGYGSNTSNSNMGSGSDVVELYRLIDDLQCGSTYHYRAVATNSGGTSYGPDRTFTTDSCDDPLPIVTTLGANVYSSSTVIIEATSYSPSGYPCTTGAYLEWGLTQNYGITGRDQDLECGGNRSFFEIVNGLQCGTEYHYRGVVSNPYGTSYGLDRTFTTLPCDIPQPTVATIPATSVGFTSASINGTVNPNGYSTLVHFEYGATDSYGDATVKFYLGSGTTTLSYTETLSNLVCETTYHFRIVADNLSGTSYGFDETFTTGMCDYSQAEPNPMPWIPLLLLNE
jgi:hypothetical protein